MLKIRLQLFAEETGGAGADVSAGAETAAAQEQTQQQSGDDFQTLISGQYKQQFEDAVGKRVQDAIGRRFRNQQDLQKRLDGYAPIMTALGGKYGLDPGDVEGIAKKLTDDDSLYAEEASQRGLPVQTLKAMRQLEAENKRLNALRQQSAEDQALHQHYYKLVTEAQQLQQTFPDFDLFKEMEQNPRFARMTAPGVGMSVQEAFYALHGQDIQRQSMRYAAQQSKQQIAASVRSGASRPMEGGMQSGQQAPMAIDPSKMSRKQLKEIADRVRAGERITLK